MCVYSLNDSQWQYKAVTWKYLQTESYQSSLIPTWSPTRILRHFIHQDCFLISISTWGCCFSDVRTGCLLQVRGHKAKYVCRNWLDEASGFSGDTCENHQPTLWCESSSYLVFLVKKPNFGFVTAGSNWSNLAATVGGAKMSIPTKFLRTIHLIWGWTM